MAFQGDSFVVGQGQDLVIVHDRVHRLDPLGVQVTIEEQPLGVLVWDLPEGTEGFGQETVLPLLGGQVVAVEIFGGDCFGVDVGYDRLLTGSVLCPSQLFPGLGLACTRRTHHKDAMPNFKQLFELDYFEDKGLVGMQLGLNRDISDDLFEIHVPFTGDFHLGE